MRVVVLLSGGVDSTVLLAHHLSKGNQVVGVTFDYNQTHVREIGAAREVMAHYDLRRCHRVVKLPGVFACNALNGYQDIPEGHAERPDETTVPARNLVMLAMAASIAEQSSASAVCFGANKDDAAGYVDCRPTFVQAMDDAISRGTTRSVSVHAPFLSWSKHQIIDYGRELGAPLELTWSCYRGGEVACGNCGACVSRIDTEWERELA